MTEKLDEMIKKQFPKTKRPSFSVLVTNNLSTLFKKAYGEEENVDKEFVVGSITKSFTALGIMILIEKGQLSPTDTLDKITNYKNENLSEYFKNPEEMKNITIKELLTHTSGLPSFGDGKKAAINPSQKEKFLYSNFGYALLGRIIEIKRCITYDQFLYFNILLQLNMTKTTTIFSKGKKYGLVQGHRNLFGFFFKSDIIEDEYEENERFYVPAGFIISNLEDMGKYLRFMMRTDDFIISYENKEKMLEPLVKIDEKYYYGYGWKLTKTNSNNIIHLHDGIVYSYCALMSFNQNKTLASIILDNSYDSFTDTNLAYELKFNIIKFVLGEKVDDISGTYILTHVIIDIIFFLLFLIMVIKLILTIGYIKNKEKIRYFSCSKEGLLVMFADIILIFGIPMVLFLIPLINMGSWGTALKIVPSFGFILFVGIFGIAILTMRLAHFTYRLWNKTQAENLEIGSVNEYNAAESCNGVQKVEFCV